MTFCNRMHPKRIKRSPARSWPCGARAKAVPALAALLPDPELTSWARIALEAIPDPAADAALRDAMGKVEGMTLIGVINSIGVRRDANAVDAIDRADERCGRRRRHRRRPSPWDASAMKRPPPHCDRPWPTAPKRSDRPLRKAAFCAPRKLLAAGKADEAAKLYDEVRAAELPKQRIVEATRGAILARGADGIPLLIEQLKSSDKAMVAIGLMTARELIGPGVSKKLVVALERCGSRSAGLVDSGHGRPG